MKNEKLYCNPSNFEKKYTKKSMYLVQGELCNVKKYGVIIQIPWLWIFCF